MRKPRTPLPRHTPLARAPMDRAKCDCGHHEWEHYQRGACDRCACTWYHPNVRVIKARIARKKRSAAETQRIYGGEARIRFVASLPCSVVGCRRVPSENAHSATGGTGRKADAATILPLCATHHRELHQIGVQTFQRLHGLDLAQCAERTARAWETRGEDAA